MKITTLIPGENYHIYNRGNNRENIFIEEKNYDYFMRLYRKYIDPIAETYAYCLLRNHFHFLMQIKVVPQDCQFSEGWQSYVSLQFRNLFSTYSKAINKAYQRTGSLFEKPFKRRHVSNDAYFRMLVVYIHQNPQKHGLIDDYRDWRFSSYQAILRREPTILERDKVLSWFDEGRSFSDFHRMWIDENDLDIID